MFLDGSGVAGSVLYPTMGLAMAHIKDVEWATVMARCYNDYLYGEYLQQEPKRLWGVALLPIQDIAAAAEELERCVKDLKNGRRRDSRSGFVARAWPSDVRSALSGRGAAERAAGGSWRLERRDWASIFYDSFMKILVMEHAVAQQIHFTSFILDGAPVRFPTLKIAFLEAGVGWVPYLMERLDEKFEKLPQQAPLLTKEPSYYVKDGLDLFFLRARREAFFPTLSVWVWRKSFSIHRTIRTSGRPSSSF